MQKMNNNEDNLEENIRSESCSWDRVYWAKSWS